MNLSTDADFLNAVVNHPSVFPYVSLKLPGPIDVTALVKDPGNVFLANEHGGFLCVNKGNGVYEVHTQFLPDGRGHLAVEAALESMRYMFTQTDCEKLETYVQDSHKHVARFTRKMGFEKREEVDLMGLQYFRYETTKDRWASCQ